MSISKADLRVLRIISEGATAEMVERPFKSVAPLKDAGLVRASGEYLMKRSRSEKVDRVRDLELTDAGRTALAASPRSGQQDGGGA